VPRHCLPLLTAALVLVACGGDPSPRPARATTEHVGPGPVSHTVAHGAYRVALGLTPNRPAVKNRLAVRVTKHGRPVAGAKVDARFEMVAMDMGTWAYRLRERAAGLYARKTSALIMAGDWRLAVKVDPPAGAPFTVHVVDRAGV
jgi:hypothetical protein